MQLVRTTIRLKDTLKKAVERKAFDDDMTLQEIFNDALEKYLDQEGRKEAKRIVFGTHRLGVNLDNLTRDDYYSEPDVS